ncbi:MAG: response regulator [Nitrososphaera sp.]
MTSQADGTADIRALIVDNNRELIDSLMIRLSQHGFQVDVYNLPSDVLGEYDVKACSLAFLGVRLPQMTGFELARELWRANPGLKVCFLSEFEINEQEARVLMPSLKSHCFLTKGLAFEDLSRRIDSLVA